MKLIFIVLLIALTSTFILWQKVSYLEYASTSKAEIPTSTPTPSPLNADKLFQLVNDWRVQNGYQAYKESEFACNIALKRLPETKINWSHDKFIQDVQAGRYCSTTCYLGENLAKEYISESDTLTAWINSPEHLRNLKASYTHSCIKIDGMYTVQIFSYF